jgi:hypothetical protein
MELNEQDKISILLEIHKEKTARIEQIKGYSFQILTWITGVFLLLVGYLLQEKIELRIYQKLFLSISLSFASIVIIWFINELEKGFVNQLQTLIKVEDILGL